MLSKRLDNLSRLYHRTANAACVRFAYNLDYVKGLCMCVE